jgi:hypothetical protein
MQREWVNPMGGFVAFPDTKTGEQVRAIGPEAIKVIVAQPRSPAIPMCLRQRRAMAPSRL